jgi:hypothetical protein
VSCLTTKPLHLSPSSHKLLLLSFFQYSSQTCFPKTIFLGSTCNVEDYSGWQTCHY